MADNLYKIGWLLGPDASPDFVKPEAEATSAPESAPADEMASIESIPSGEDASVASAPENDVEAAASRTPGRLSIEALCK